MPPIPKHKLAVSAGPPTPKKAPRRECIACEGMGRNSNNYPCQPCAGTGIEGTYNKLSEQEQSRFRATVEAMKRPSVDRSEARQARKDKRAKGGSGRTPPTEDKKAARKARRAARKAKRLADQATAGLFA